MSGAIFPKEGFSGRMSLEFVSSWYINPLLYYFASQKISTALVEDSEAAGKRSIANRRSAIERRGIFPGKVLGERAHR